MVQIGNEIRSGLLFPDGELPDYAHRPSGGYPAPRPGGWRSGMQLVHAGHRVLAPAVLTGNAAVALQRADKAGKAQLRLAGSRLRNEFLDLALHGLVVQLVRLDGRLCGSLGLLGISRRHLGRRDAAVQLALLGLHLAVLAVQLFLLALQVSLLAHQLGTVAFQRGLVGFQPGLGGFQSYSQGMQRFCPQA